MVNGFQLTAGGRLPAAVDGEARLASGILIVPRRLRASPRFQEGGGFRYHRAMAENHDLAHAMTRLDALTDWERRPRNTMRVGLEPMWDLATRLGDPQKSFRSIHVAGTKGKGSVSALIEAALAHAGLRVGRYASPHVERITERVSVQGHDVDEPTLARALNRALDASETAREAGTAAVDATWFDLLTAAAFIIFTEAQCEWAVIEVGLG